VSADAVQAGCAEPAVELVGIEFDVVEIVRKPFLFTLYDVSNDNITGNVVVGQVGLEWTVSGFGDFSTRASETDMLMRNSNTGAFEVYDIANNAITFAGPMGRSGWNGRLRALATSPATPTRPTC
jgi:hypothetical protein